MQQPAYDLDRERRRIVLEAIREVCRHREWTLLAAHVRTTHVHLVVGGTTAPEPMLHACKAYSSRSLNRIEPPRKRWTRYGSTRYLKTQESIAAAIDYVVSRQGIPMELYLCAPSAGRERERA